MDEQRHVALPKLYGAPAYARPPVVAANPAPRPIDPDDLPLVAEMTAEDVEELEHVDDPAILGVLAALEEPPASDVAAVPLTEAAAIEERGGDGIGDGPGDDSIRPRPFSIQELADRIRGLRS